MGHKQSQNSTIPRERFTCQSCGRCCTMWTITVDERHAERIRAHDFGLGAASPLLPNRGGADPLRLRMIGDKCIFLDGDRRCRVHNELGYDAKPAGCKAFPLHVGKAFGRTHLRLSFYCPSVCQGHGKPLAEQSRWIDQTIKVVGAVERVTPLTIDGTVELTARELELIDALCARLLQNGAQGIGLRLAACAGVLARITTTAARQGKRGLAALLSTLSAADFAELAADGLAEGRASRAGPAMSLFLGQDCPPRVSAKIRHFFGVRLFNLGMAPLSSFATQSRATRRQLDRVAASVDAATDAVFERYLLHKLSARRHVLGDDSLRAGFNLLVAGFAVAALQARLLAASRGAAVPSDEDVLAGIQAADLLVVEHTTLHHAPAVAALVSAVLGQPHVAADILTRAGVTLSALRRAGDNNKGQSA